MRLVLATQELVPATHLLRTTDLKDFYTPFPLAHLSYDLPLEDLSLSKFLGLRLQQFPPTFQKVSKLRALIS